MFKWLSRWFPAPEPRHVHQWRDEVIYERHGFRGVIGRRYMQRCMTCNSLRSFDV